MAGKIILHLCSLDKFIDPFYEFAKSNFQESFNSHVFYIKNGKSSHKLPSGQNVLNAEKLGRIGRYAALLRKLYQADKIILHGIFDYQVLLLLFINPWLLNRCYWIIWGGDLYFSMNYKKNISFRGREFIRKMTIKNIGHFVTQVRGDYELVQKWYGARGVWHECFMYPSNLYCKPPVQVVPHDGVNILLGNSADPSNNHIESLDKIKSYSGADIQVYCPLSYGDPEYGKAVEDYGKNIFGKKFVALFEFMELDEYIKLLSKIDVAIFNHKRQQGMGNITTLLGLGKKVYMRSDVTSWLFFNELGVKVFDVETINLDKFSGRESNKNKIIISEYFSRDSLVRQLMEVFK